MEVYAKNKKPCPEGWLVDENGAAVILKNNVPRYLVLEFSQAEQEQSTDEESLRAISQRLITKNRKAFRDMAI